MNFTTRKTFIGTIGTICQHCKYPCEGRKMEAFHEKDGHRNTLHVECADSWLAWVNTVSECEQETSSDKVIDCAIKKTEAEEPTP